MSSRSLFGFQFRAEVAWLLVFALLLVSLVTSVGSTGPATLSGEIALLVAAVVVALVLVSIVVHELTHALVARRLGMRPTTIQLMTLGRPTAIEAEPSSPGRDATVAAAGPLVSGAVGMLLVGVALAVPTRASEPLLPVYWACYWLGLANLALAGFHLVPVLPLDGGRLVRAVAWAVGRDLEVATRATSLVGRGFGWLLMGSGVYLALLSAEVFLGIWLVLLGWFTGRLARAAVDRRRMEQLTRGLTVADVTDTEPATIPPSLTVDTLVAQDAQGDGPGIYPVMERDRLLGIVFVSRLRRPFRRGWTDERAADVLVPLDRAPSFRPEEPLLRAVERLESMRADGFPVLESGAETSGQEDVAGRDAESAPVRPVRLVGVVTRRRVLERLRARQRLLDERVRSTPGPARSQARD